MLRFLNIDFKNRVTGLDVMRSIAILLVVFGHYSVFLKNHLNISIPFINLTINEFFYYLITGFDGVDLFFVLSGFLIGHSLLKAFVENKLDLNYLIHNFWIKRWFRTLPNYILILTFSILLFNLIPSESQTANIDFSRYYFFVQNLTNGELQFFPESWSLSIEEWFYIMFPLSIAIIALFSLNPNKRRYLLLAGILSFIVLGTLFRLYYVTTNDFSLTKLSLWNSEIRTSIVMRFDAIIYGVLMAYIKINSPQFFNRYRYHSLLIGLCILTLGFKFMFFNASEVHGYVFAHGYYFTFVGAGMAMLLPYFDGIKLKSRNLVLLFTFLSVISYSVYLTNYSIVMHLVNYFLPSEAGIFNNLSKFFLAVFSTLIISMLLYKFVETPFMLMRKKVIAKNYNNRVRV